jgi:hypothetical protein
VGERCPGQDLRHFNPDDVYEVPCPSCRARVEFFRDDRSRKCPSCGARFRNPRIDMRCAEWCPYARECLDYDPKEEDG